MWEVAKRWKWAHQVYNYFQKNKLAHNIPLYKEHGIQKRYYSSVSSTDFQHIDAPRPFFDTHTTRDELPKEALFQSLPEAWQQSLLGWSENGFATLPGAFSAEEVDDANRALEGLIDERKVRWRGNRILFAHRQHAALNALGTDDRLTKVLDMLMQREVQLFQSINFLHGSEQRAHSDAIHMTTFPFGHLVAVWVALEDIHQDSGPLQYYPGSHQLPYIMNADFGNEGTRWTLGKKHYSDYEDEVQRRLDNTNLSSQVWLAKKGDVLVWHANLIHGGLPVTDPSKTRKSMVFHYYSKDVICYHEITQRPTLMG